MPLKLPLTLDLISMSRKLQLVVWLAAAICFLLILGDWTSAFVQTLFPFLTGKPQVTLFDSLKISTASVSEDEYQQLFTRRNIFSSEMSRPQIVSVPTIDAELGHLELSGILSGREKRAIFRDRQTKQSYFVKVGDSLGSLSVKEVEPGSVIVASGDEEREIRLEK